MTTFSLRIITRGALAGVALSLLLDHCGQAAAAPPAGIPPELVADYIHAVIEADRAVYADRVVQRLQNKEGVIKASEHFEADKALPLPAQMLRMGSQLVSEKGVGFRYALISPWAINKANLPKTEFEKQGVASVVADRTKPFRTIQEVAGKRYFMAVYADIAVSPACAACHNDHSESPRKDFKTGDVMGGVVITLPLP
ncbi:MAG TPA: DUF3365 domain-containing protein [Thermoanaerobaculia bacterium]|nr:DUF3365 domain-containing protein [Thermoanaerobaculia bacterium]